MSGGLRGINFAISDQAIADLIARRLIANLDLRPLTSADAGRSETFRLLPFSDEADEVDAYLEHDQIWFVTLKSLGSFGLLWIPKETNQKFKNELHENERIISLTGVIPNLSPTEEDELGLQKTIQVLLTVGARRLLN